VYAEKKFKETLDASMLDQPQKEKVLGLWRNAWDNSIAALNAAVLIGSIYNMSLQLLLIRV